MTPVQYHLECAERLEPPPSLKYGNWYLLRASLGIKTLEEARAMVKDFNERNKGLALFRIIKRTESAVE